MAGWLVLLALTGCGPAEATGEGSRATIDDVPQEVMDAMAAWAACRAAYVRDNIDRQVTAEALVDTALDICADRQQEVDRVFSKLGGSWVGLAAQFRERSRTEMITAVEQTRAGQPLSDPNRAWGVCVGQNLPAETTPAEFDVAFDSAVVACSAYEPGVRDWLAKTGGPAAVEANWRSYVERLREHARAEFMPSR